MHRFVVTALTVMVSLACRAEAPTLGPAPAPAPAPAPKAAPPAAASAADEPIGPKPRGPPRPAARRAAKHLVAGQLNLNRATEAELRLLPGIGKGRAKAIVERRKDRPFTSLEEVARIRGLKSIVRRLRPHLTLVGPTTLRPVESNEPAG
jgi:competence protein ComEA